MGKLARNWLISWSEAYSLPSTYTRVIYGNQLRQSPIHWTIFRTNIVQFCHLCVVKGTLMQI